MKMRFHKPILRECPGCGEKSYWRWIRDTVDEKNRFRIVTFKEQQLACDNCGWIENPVNLGVKPYAAWKEDPDSYEIVDVQGDRKKGE